MATNLELVPGKDTFTLLDLLRKAAAHKGLKFEENVSRVCTEPFKTYVLDDELMRALADRDIVRKHSEHPLNLWAIGDRKYQQGDSTMQHAHWWRFGFLKDKPTERDFRLQLLVALEFNQTKRSIVFHPEVSATLAHPANQYLNCRMWNVLVEIDKDSSSVAKELAAGGEAGLLVTWTDMGLGGIRSFENLFDEFADGKQTLCDLAQSREVFFPLPYARYESPGDEIFVVENMHHIVFDTWERQRYEYIRRLR